MAFHRFQRLPAEIRLQIWECAAIESRLVDVPLTCGQKRVCRMTAPQSSPESTRPTSKLVTPEDNTIGSVCQESREAARRCGLLHSSRDYDPATDVVYVDDSASWCALDRKSRCKVRHLAISAHICYEVMKLQESSSTALDPRGWPQRVWRGFVATADPDFVLYGLFCCPKLQSVTIVLPPLEMKMPQYAKHFTLDPRPSFLRVVPYSEVPRIRITGPYTYKSRLRGSANTKRLLLWPFIMDVKDVWTKGAELSLRPVRSVRSPAWGRGIRVRAGVVQHLQRSCTGETRLSSIYKVTRETEEDQPEDQDEMGA